MPKLTIRVSANEKGKPTTHTVAADGPMSLETAIRNAGVDFAMPCGGNHTCGKCAVQAKGALSDETEAERALLLRARLGAADCGYRWRMACLCEAWGDAEILVPDRAVDVQVAGFGAAVAVAATGACGLAVDIGTTTVSVALYDLAAGTLIKDAHELSAQARFGADVLSRIEYSNAHGTSDLTAAIRGQLSRMMDAVCEKAGVAGPEKWVITGNTTMLHYLADLDPRGIGVSPFVPMSLFGRAFELFDAKVFLPRCISAYVGADISCGMLVTGLCDGDGPELLVDVGTNGEMAIRANGKTLCCATAAGPAFEGAEIEMGMAAVSGAISKVREVDGQIAWDTIRGARPIGICGTGLISAVDLMIRAGALSGAGRIEADGHRFAHLVTERGGQPAFALGDSGVCLTQRDIRSIQLAKAAIRGGIETMLHEAGLKAGDLLALHISGGFGSYIDPLEAAGIGLIPEEALSVVKAGGNTALAGAVRLLLDDRAGERVALIAEETEEVPLATNPYFMDQYVEQMAFYEE